jgi:hypothetical protein
MRDPAALRSPRRNQEKASLPNQPRKMAGAEMPQRVLSLKVLVIRQG